jgi:hypothetical protein
MNAPTPTRRRTRLIVAGIAAVLAVIALTPAPAQARVFLSFGAPFGSYYAPGPYYYGYPGPYYNPYYAPPAYYPPPPAPAYPPASSYAPPAPAYPPAPTAAYTPSAPSYSPAPAATYTPPSTGGSPGASGITYTSRPAFTNSAGQTCREYKTTETGGGHPIDVLGTACKQADGTWRVVN